MNERKTRVRHTNGAFIVIAFYNMNFFQRIKKFYVKYVKKLNIKYKAPATPPPEAQKNASPTCTF